MRIRDNLSAPSLDVIKDTVYHYVKKNPSASVLGVANQTGLMEYQVKKAWRNLGKSGELPRPAWVGKSPGSPKGKSPGSPKGKSPGSPKGKSPGRPKGMTNAIAAWTVGRECDAVAAFLAKNPGTSCRTIAKFLAIPIWHVYRARKLLEETGEIGAPTRWGSGRQHKTYVNFLLTVNAPV